MPVETDAFIRKILKAVPFQMGTAEFHHLLGKYVWEVEKQLGKEFLPVGYGL